MGTHKPYISKLEKGQMNPTFDVLVNYAAFFGVQYYELGNPKVPVPEFDQLPAMTRKAIKKLRVQKQAEKSNSAKVKALKKEEGVPGRAKQLHNLVSTGFFKKSKTAKDAFLKLNPGLSEQNLGSYNVEISKITVTLSSGRFHKLLDKLEPAPGSTAVRFVIKDPSVLKYLDNPAGTKDMAADGEFVGR